MKKYSLLTGIQALIFLLSFFTGWYHLLTIGLMIVVVISMLDNLGKGVVLREIIAMHICFVCLIMPLVGYDIFNVDNRMARMFIKYMPVSEATYYDFALPAVSGFILALCWPVLTRTYSDKGQFMRKTIEKARVILRGKTFTGLYLLIIGTIMFQVSKFLPAVVQFVFQLMFFAGFAGYLYVFYQDTFRYRRLILIFFTLFIIATALSSGIFTVVAYMSLTLFSFFFLGRKIKLWKKILLFMTGTLVLLIIQMVKPAYRTATWGTSYSGNKAALFGELIADKIVNPSLESADAFFPIYVRVNQGFNVALVMRRFPDKQPFDKGVNLLTNFASALVPRVLWPNKPEAGGKFNMMYYTGIYLNGWSTNVGPLGEAYGSFGVNGAIAYMIFLGWFIRWSYAQVFKLARKTPLLIFWIPVLFYQVTYAAETDTLQIMNSLFKSAFLIWLMYKYIPRWFGAEKQKNMKRRLPEVISNTHNMVPEN